MSRLLVAASVAGSLLVTQATAAGADASLRERARIAVRVYGAADASVADRSAVMTAADAIFTRARLDVEWRDCQPEFARPNLRLCGVPLDCNEFVLRLVPAEAPATEFTEGTTTAPESNRLGYSLIDMDTGTGALATVHPDRVGWLARISGTDTVTLLARAIAHEIGHLVLGTNRHRSEGIMRAVWSAEALQRNAPGDWAFTDDDRADMRSAIRLRLARRQAVTHLVWGAVPTR